LFSPTRLSTGNRSGCARRDDRGKEAVASSVPERRASRGRAAGGAASSGRARRRPIGRRFSGSIGVSYTKEQVASGDISYNFGTTPYAHEELHGISVFFKEGAGDVLHTYSSYARGGDILLGAHNYLDLTPKGRNESGTMSWVRYHDRYEGEPAAKAERSAGEARCAA
jgi:hypothetical protein